MPGLQPQKFKDSETTSFRRGTRGTNITFDKSNNYNYKSFESTKPIPSDESIRGFMPKLIYRMEDDNLSSTNSGSSVIPVLSINVYSYY